MPMGATGRRALGRYVDLQGIKQRLERRFEPIPALLPGGGPARDYRLGGTETPIGFITPLSHHFCQSGNRVRPAVDGTLHLRLGQETSYPPRPLLRAGTGDDELVDHLRRAIAREPERHAFNERLGQVVRVMAQTGG